MPIPLLPTDLKLLRVMDERGGLTTRDVCIQAHLPRGPSDVPGYRSAILHMQKLGLVTTLDDQKPVAWLRTPAGTAALREYEAEGV